MLFLTTLNLASNPRLVKEIRLALHLKKQVTVICFRFNNWSTGINDKLLSEFQDVKIIQIDGEKSSFFSWLTSSISEWINRKLSKWISLPLFMHAVAISRRSQLLVDALKKVSAADWVVGHNPGAIYATYKASQKFKCKSGFDVEDYHPGEGNDKHLQNITLSLMKKIFPKFNYVSFASQSILNESEKKIGSFLNQKSIVVNNCFPENEFIEPATINDNRLRVVWFSQHIDKSRGLEQIIPIVHKHFDKINLTLFGNCNESFKQKYIDGQNGIELGGIMPQLDLHQRLSTFDIGLAIEPGKDLNNELALSNKVYAYLQAGLFIIATDTIEQHSFLKKLPDAGIIVNKKFTNIEDLFIQLHANIENLRNEKLNRFAKAKSYSWQNLSTQLTNLWVS
jgi:glycosyltransferase involved in cell wall biosynthesis